MENSGKGSPVAHDTNRALAAAGPIFRLLMRPRELEHPDACDFVAGNPQEIASTDERPFVVVRNIGTPHVANDVVDRIHVSVLPRINKK